MVNTRKLKKQLINLVQRHLYEPANTPTLKRLLREAAMVMYDNGYEDETVIPGLTLKVTYNYANSVLVIAFRSLVTFKWTELKIC